MSRHLTAVPGGRPVRGGYISSSKNVADLTPPPSGAFWQHPVHGDRRANVLEAHFASERGEHPYIARLAVSVLYAELGKLREDTDWAVCDNALQDLAAYMSKPAPEDDASPFGIPRPGGVA